MNTAPNAADLRDLIATRIRADVRAMHAYAVQDAAGLTKLDAMENPYSLPPELQAKLAGVDPGNAYGVPYTWGTIGLGMNKEAVEKRLPGVALDTAAADALTANELTLQDSEKHTPRPSAPPLRWTP